MCVKLEDLKVNVRRFKSGDEPALIEFWQTVFPNDPPHNNPSLVLEAKLKVDDLIFVSEDEGEIVGACMAGYDGHRGWLYAVAVLNEYRRKGIGKKLVQTTMASLKDIGCIKVNLQIRSTNVEVANFYTSLGYVVEDRLSMGAHLK